MSTNKGRGDSLSRFWWQRLPEIASRLSREFSLILSDGMYLTFWPLLGRVMPLAALFLGLICGWLRLGGEDVFTQSAATITLALVLGFTSGQLGVLFVAGYIFGDFVLYNHPGFDVVSLVTNLQLRIALMITYIGLSVLAIGIPFTTKLVKLHVVFLRKVSSDINLVVNIVISGFIGAALVYVFLQALPMLVRPLFIWRDQSPPIEAVSPLQSQAWLLAAFTFMLATVRSLAEYSVLAVAPEITDRYSLDSSINPRRTPLVSLAPLPRILIHGVVNTLLVAGLLDAWTSTAIAFGGFLIIGAIQSYLHTIMPVWVTVVARIPVIVRLIAVLVVSLLMSAAWLGDRLSGVSFQPLVWALLFSSLCIACTFPEKPTRS